MLRPSRTDPATGTIEIPGEPVSKVFCLEVGEPRCHRSVAVAEGCTLIVGSRPGCDLTVNDKTVSARHCLVRFERGNLWVEDQGSRNGVFVGGARVQKAQLIAGASFVVGRATVAVRSGVPGLQANSTSGSGLPSMIGGSSAMQRVADQVRRLAPLSVPVLVRGATGTGKDLVARALHDLSPRANRPYVALNAGALPRDLAAAELFGHERGAFTGAHARREGAFVAANGGTLFLDEIGELSAEVQVKLLRALEEGEIRRLGSNCSVRVSVRIVAATWAHLEQSVEQGLFREDLYHRLAVGMINLPPLTDRRSDISALVDHFLSRCAPEIGTRRISSAALGCLVAQRWPGNVRQLRNIIMRAALTASGEVISASDVEQALHDQPASLPRMSKASAQSLVGSCDGKVARAARLCGVPRSTFRAWLKSDSPSHQ